MDRDAAQGADISESALQGVVLGRLGNGGFGHTLPLCLLDTEVVLQMCRALLVPGRIDVEDEVIAAIAAHAGDQGPPSAFWIMCLIIALRLDDEKIMIKGCAGARWKDAQ